MSYATNDRSRFDYEIIERLDAGLVLEGSEVKSIRTGKVSIKGSFVKIVSGQAYLIGATISPYQQGNVPEGYDAQKSRKLLLKKNELAYLLEKSAEDGLTIVPLKLFDKGGLIKLEIGIGKGKKKHDKRESIAKRETSRKLGRILKQD